MADIVINFQTFYEVDPTVAKLFVASGIAKYLSTVKAEQPPAPEPPPDVDTFSVGTIGLGATPVLILKRPSGETTTYGGHPSGAAEAFQVRIWDGVEQRYRMQGPVPPKTVLDAYERAFPQDASTVAERKRLQIQEAQVAQAKQDAPGVRRW